MGGGKALQVSDRGSERIERPPAGGSEMPPSHEMEVAFGTPRKGGRGEGNLRPNKKKIFFFEGGADADGGDRKKRVFVKGPARACETLDKKFFFVTGSKGECREKATGVRTKPRAYLWRGFVKLWLLLRVTLVVYVRPTRAIAWCYIYANAYIESLDFFALKKQKNKTTSRPLPQKGGICGRLLARSRLGGERARKSEQRAEPSRRLERGSLRAMKSE